MQIIDNFLPDKEFRQIYNLMLSADFPWYFANSKLPPTHLIIEEKYNYQFGHSFYRDYAFHSNYGVNIIPIIKKIAPITIFRIKGFLLPRADKIAEYGYHLDNEYNTKVAIYYVNTNNGYTKFEDGTVVDSIANRMVLFDGNIKHTGSTCTDQKIRCGINFNYF
jgi:hypothetical protein